MLNHRWPDFFIVGAPRTGTTSLQNYFEEIPNILMCPKESGYFSKLSPGPTISEENYSNSFQIASDKQLVGDATAIYLRDPETPQLIHDANPDAKIIIMLRDPVERAFSHYLMYLRDGYETDSFSNKLKDFILKKPTSGNFYNYIIMPSFYHKSITRYLNIFGKKNIKILIYEDFSANTIKIVQEILDFLDISGFMPKNIGKKYNEYGKPLGETGRSIIENTTIKNIAKRFLPKSKRTSLQKTIFNQKGQKPTLNENDTKILQDLFQDDVIQLKKSLNRNLNWIHFPEN